MKNLFNRFVREEQGQDLIEYALLAGLISLASVVAITALGTAIQGHFTAAGAAAVDCSPVVGIRRAAWVCPAASFSTCMSNRRTGGSRRRFSTRARKVSSDPNARANFSR